MARQHSSNMKNRIDKQFLKNRSVKYNELCKIGFTLIFSICYVIPAYSQFADLPTDAKTVDFGISGDIGSQTLSLTAVLPLKNINGWSGIFGSRASDDDGVDSEIVKIHIQGGMRINKFGIEAFTDLERNN